MMIGFLGALINNENLGCLALTYSQINLIEDIAKEKKIEVKYSVFENHPNSEMVSLLEKKLPITPGKITAFDITPLFNFRRFIRHFMKGLKTWQAFKRCDLFIDLTAGDSFSDIYGQYIFDSETNVKLLVKKLNKPLILGPQTYGPYEKKTNLSKAIKTIEKADVVISRDMKSVDYLSQYTKKKIEVTTDLAFMLPYENEYEKNGDKIRVGINVSGLLVRQKTESTSLTTQFKTDYETYLTSVVDWLLEKDCYEIYAIPHVGNDGLDLFRKIYGDKINYKGPYKDPISAKNDIASMDIFIGSRMHATIAAFSSGVCTIPVAYSRKFSGLFNHLNYDYIIDIADMTTDVAFETTVKYIEDYQKIKDKVSESMKKIQEETEKNRSIYRDFLVIL